jgi:hypothetical protein
MEVGISGTSVSQENESFQALGVRLRRVSLGGLLGEAQGGGALSLGEFRPSWYVVATSTPR